jgi:hypothetical protein
MERNGNKFTFERDAKGMWVCYKNGVEVGRDYYKNDLIARINLGKFD